MQSNLHVSGSESTTVEGANGDELWIFERGNLIGLGVALGTEPDSPGKAVLLDEAGAVRVIAELSRRLAARTTPLEEALRDAAEKAPARARSHGTHRREPLLFFGSALVAAAGGRVISIGVDTGLSNAITVLEAHVGTARPRFISTRTIAIGHKVKLAKPRKMKGKGKGGADGRVQTEETVIDDSDLLEFWREVRDAFTAIRCSDNDATIVLTVERCDTVYAGGLGERFGGSMGTGLVRAAWIGGEVASIGRWIFGADRVSTVSEEQWRKALIGGTPAKGASEDQMIARLIPMAIEGWPASSNNHNRDAGGVAKWGIERARMVALRDRLNSMPRMA